MFFKVFNDGTQTVTTDQGDKTAVSVSIDLGMGKASAVGVHVGAELGAKGFIQQSTGKVAVEQLNPAFNIKSGLKSWKEK